VEVLIVPTVAQTESEGPRMDTDNPAGQVVDRYPMRTSAREVEEPGVAKQLASVFEVAGQHDQFTAEASRVHELVCGSFVLPWDVVGWPFWALVLVCRAASGLCVGC